MFRIESLYRAGFALGALSLIVFFLGHLGLLSSPFLILALIASGAVFFISGWRNNPGTRPPLSKAEWALLLASFAALLAIIPLALLPPAVRDELIQHLALPRLYLQKGRIFEIGFIGFSYLPQNIDLLYLVPLAFGSDIVPRLIHLGFGVLTGLLVYFYVSERAGRAYGLLGFLLYISTPLVFNLSRMAYTDNAAAFYSTLALFAALRWKDGFDLKWLLFSAASTGFALGVKYNAAITLILIGAFIVFHGARRRGALEGLRSGALYIFVALLILSPWLVRNHLWGHNPFYPIYETAVRSSLSGEGLHVTGEMAPAGKRFLLYKETALDVILLPLRIFWEGADNSIERFDGVLNPLLLLFIPLAFIKKSNGAIKHLALFSLLFFVMAASTADLATRYLMPALPAVIVIAVFGAKNLFEARKEAAIAALAALFAFNAFYASRLYSKYRPFDYLLGAGARGDYLQATLPDYKAVEYANANLPANAKVLLLFSGDRGYYWEREYLYWDRTGVTFEGLVKRYHNDADGLRAAFKGFGVTHLFVNDRIFEGFANDNFSADELKGLAEFFQRRSRRVYGANGFSIFELE
ncbi:MAG: glycosyltransferase family 39 protein [Deltaproteobacteria bacterium]|nr:glycosyltransferase family 39 protein [Deltaproteobacteria bacterium]